MAVVHEAHTSTRSSPWKDLIAFWIFGLANNYAYVIMLSAAADILSLHGQGTSQSDLHTTRNQSALISKLNGSSSTELCEEDVSQRRCNLMSTGAVLLADAIPSLLVKLVAPFFMHHIPFGIRHFIVCVTQALSYVIVAFSGSVAVALTGVAFASFASGFGESSYLALTTHYKRDTIAAWASGTGGAGLVGAGAYALLTEPHLANLSPRTTLLVMLVVPAVFAATYWSMLTPAPTVHKAQLRLPSSWLVSKEELNKRFQTPTSNELSISTTTNRGGGEGENMGTPIWEPTFVEKLWLIGPLLKYMVSLAVVYIAEYLVNQGIAELIYFDCSHGLRLSMASQYRWYQALYQLGVLISRSSINCLELPSIVLYSLPFLQTFNLILFFFDAVYAYVPHIVPIFGLIFIEGLFGGAAYVNTFHKIHTRVPIHLKEYSLSVVSLADTLGIVVAGFSAIPIHNFICSMDMYRIAQ